MQHYDDEGIVNIGTGTDLPIAELADLVRTVTGYQGEIVYDAGKPDGTLRKPVDVGRISAPGWRAEIPLQEGVASTCRWLLEHVAGT